MDMNCPKCMGKLSLQTLRHDEIYKDPVMSGEGLEKHLEYYQCFICQGIWIDISELEEILAEKTQLIHTATPFDNNSALARTVKETHCPRCDSPLARKGAPHDERVLCEYCAKCRGIWLDPGKIDLIEEDSLTVRDRLVRFLNGFGFDRDVRRLG